MKTHLLSHIWEEIMFLNFQQSLTLLTLLSRTVEGVFCGNVTSVAGFFSYLLILLTMINWDLSGGDSSGGLCLSSGAAGMLVNAPRGFLQQFYLFLRRWVSRTE